jgi:hypothetical protein
VFNDDEIARFLLSNLYENEYAGSSKDISLKLYSANFIFNGAEHLFPKGYH